LQTNKDIPSAAQFIATKKTPLQGFLVFLGLVTLPRSLICNLRDLHRGLNPPVLGGLPSGGLRFTTIERPSNSLPFHISMAFSASSSVASQRNQILLSGGHFINDHSCGFYVPACENASSSRLLWCCRTNCLHIISLP